MARASSRHPLRLTHSDFDAALEPCVQTVLREECTLLVTRVQPTTLDGVEVSHTSGPLVADALNAVVNELTTTADQLVQVIMDGSIEDWNTSLTLLLAKNRGDDKDIIAADRVIYERLVELRDTILADESGTLRQAAAGEEDPVSPTLVCPEIVLEPHVVDEIKDMFNKQDRDGDGRIDAIELAEAWKEALRKGGAQKCVDTQLMASEVARTLDIMDINGDGTVDLQEFIHAMLINGTMPNRLMEVNELVRRKLRKDPGVLDEIIDNFMRLDETGEGRLTYKQICQGMLTDVDGDDVKKEALEAMDLDNSGNVDYYEYLYYILGRRKEKVELLYYDISNGTSKALSPILFSHRVDAIWHTSVVVFGREWWFGGNVFRSIPETTPFGTPIKRIELGYTLHTENELYNVLVERLSLEYTPDTYDVMTKNCNNFTNDVSLFLLQKQIPLDILDMPHRLMGSGLARILRPFLNHWLGGFGDDAEPDSEDNLLHSLADKLASGDLASVNTMVHYSPPGQPSQTVQITAVNKKKKTVTVRRFQNGEFIIIRDVPYSKLSSIDNYTNEHAYFAALAVLLKHADEIKEEEDLRQMQKMRKGLSDALLEASAGAASGVDTSIKLYGGIVNIEDKLKEYQSWHIDTRGMVSDEERNAFFKSLRSKPANRTCIDCMTRNPVWISTGFGVFVCLNCSGRHRQMGVHITFVRSCEMDKLPPQYLIQMDLGGNERARDFFKQHNMGPGCSKPIDYHGRWAAKYRQMLQKEVDEVMGKLHYDIPNGEVENGNSTEPTATASATAGVAEVMERGRNHNDDKNKKKAAPIVIRKRPIAAPVVVKADGAAANPIPATTTHHTSSIFADNAGEVDDFFDRLEKEAAANPKPLPMPTKPSAPISGGGGFVKPVPSKVTLKGGFSTSDELLAFAPAAAEEEVSNELAIVPFESSVFGPYIHVYDTVLRGGLKIFAEYSQVEKHCLIGGTNNTTLSTLKTVYSHPWILRNSREFLVKHKYSRVEINSTSHAVELIAAHRDDPTIAAIGSTVQAEKHGLHIMKENVACDENTQTRYAIVGPANIDGDILECLDNVPLKSALCVSIKDEPSALFKALASFSLRNLNISNVVLRPLAMFPSFREALPGGGQHWDYCFYIEYEAGSNDCEEALVASLKELSGPVVQRLGNRYPSFVRHSHYRHPDWKSRSDESVSWEQLREFLSR
ncbi:hypothetical protein FOL47_010014 [Perkinsus chesapeaki]|uniref:Calmodulin n=1 Tax=Perkinsus chesapeaki TaxID=330153 RepID=A0A7J6MR47_PERCH|nr:hypothetical protein FOL47_010014 [Perkinsus chesapeaki]